jgi:NodT family efflux transporter outer membrane factor (OMF) lipoprotein
MKSALPAVLMAASLLLAACSSSPPSQAVAPASSERFLRASDANAFDCGWWRRFADPTLQALLDEAQRSNLDVQQAITRVQQARAGALAQGSRLLPTLSLGGSASDARSDLPEAVKRGQPDTRALRAALDLQWELDLFGAARAAHRAAQAEELAAQAGVDGARLLLSSELAQQYLQWQSARIRQQQLAALLAAQASLLQHAEQRRAQGVSSALQVEAEQAELQALRQQAPLLRLLQQNSEHRIALLLGRSPSQPVPALLQAPLALPEVPTIAPGQPLALLQRRPDLRAAQARLEAASARADERRLDRYPKLFLAGLLGRQDLRLNGLDLAPSPFQNIALAFALPLFNGGRLEAQAEAARAQASGFDLAQQQAWLTALQEVESALATLQAGREREQAFQLQLQAREQTQRHAERLHRVGLSAHMSLLQAERGLQAARLELSQAQLDTTLNAVQLAKALGGGWTLENPP